MTTVILELLRTGIAASVLFALIRGRRTHELHDVDGWRPLLIGFSLILFGTLIDITENFPELDRFVVVGNTPVEAFLEQVVGYLLGFVFLAVGVWRWLPTIAQHQKMMAENLSKAEKELDAIHDLLPICASCKKIRDDQGYWQQIEAYISEHSQATFTHGICPACEEKLYPGMRQRVEAKEARERTAKATAGAHDRRAGKDDPR